MAERLDEDDVGDIETELVLTFAIEGGDIIFSENDVKSIEKTDKGWKVVFLDVDTREEQTVLIQIFKPA